MMTDPIADMLARIRNSIMARHEYVEIPYSRMKEHIARILKEEGFVEEVRVEEPQSKDKNRKTFPILNIRVRYGQDGRNAIDGLRRISTPGRRVYVRCDLIPKVRSGTGMSILSTSRGVMTDREAKAKGIGGERLFEVW